MTSKEYIEKIVECFDVSSLYDEEEIENIIKQIRAEAINEVIEHLREEVNRMSACKQRDGYRMAILDLVGLKEQK